MVLLQRCQEPDLSRVRVRHVKITWVVLSQILKMSLQEKQIPYDIIYTWNLKYGTMNLRTKQKQTYRQGEQLCGCQGGREREWETLGVWGLWTKMSYI